MMTADLLKTMILSQKTSNLDWEGRVNIIQVRKVLSRAFESFIEVGKVNILSFVTSKSLSNSF